MLGYCLHQCFIFWNFWLCKINITWKFNAFTIFLSELLQIAGLNQGNALGPSIGQEEQTSKRPSDILDSTTHELQLEKSNILMLGPTGSGKLFSMCWQQYYLSMTYREYMYVYTYIFIYMCVYIYIEREKYFYLLLLCNFLNLCINIYVLYMICLSLINELKRKIHLLIIEWWWWENDQYSFGRIA